MERSLVSRPRQSRQLQVVARSVARNLVALAMQQEQVNGNEPISETRTLKLSRRQVQMEKKSAARVNRLLVRTIKVTSLVPRERLVLNSAKELASLAKRNKPSRLAQLGLLDRIRRQASHRKVATPLQQVRQMAVRLWALCLYNLTAQSIQAVKPMARSLRVKRQV